MKYFICTRDDVNSKKIEHKIDEALLKHGFIKDEYNPEIIISLGGDGTFLRAIHKYLDVLDKVSFIGMHTGKLGFFCEFTRNEAEELIDMILNVEPKIIEHKLLEIKYKKEKYYGINEVRVENPYNTMICNVYIDGELLENFRGNGLNFSTSIGSSAYNRSLGGPLMDPNIESIIVGEVASINHNAYRSLNSFLVLDENNYITLRGKFKRCLIGYDHMFVNIDSEKITDEIKVRLSDKKVRLLHYKKIPYFYRLRKAFVAD